MAYDGYVAICNPLHYIVTMSKQCCNLLVAACYAIGLVDSVINTYFIFRLPFCHSNIINHFYCDMLPLLVLSCSDTNISEIVLSAAVCYIVVSSIVTILLFYVCIISTILKISFAKGWCKAFSTCTCHLTSVVIFHGILLFTYFQLLSSYSLDTEKITSVFYTLRLNPLIYSLRNREVKSALRKAMNKLSNS